MNVRPASAADTASRISSALVTLVRFTSAGTGRLTGRSPAPPRPPPGRARASAVTHLARADVGDAAPGSGASKVGPAVSTLRPREQLGTKKPSGRSSTPRLEHAPMPTSPQAWSPAAGPNTATPSARICATLRCVGGDSPSGGSSPGDDQRHGARQTKRAEQVVGVAMGEGGRGNLRSPGRRGSRIGVAAEVDVRHVVGHARIPQVGPHRDCPKAPGRSPGSRSAPALAQHHVHLGAGLAEQAHQLGRLGAAMPPPTRGRSCDCSTCS